MKQSEPAIFHGFTTAFPHLLNDLRDHNTRGGFAEHRDEYQAKVLAPLRSLGEFLAPHLTGIDDRLVLKLSRPQRDVRFSKGKSPYRTGAWLAFRREIDDWPTTPAFFFEVSPSGWRYGSGYYAANPRTMAALRELAMADTPRLFRALSRAKSAGFALEGDTYRRAVTCDPSLPNIVAELHRRRNIYLVCEGTYETGRPGVLIFPYLHARPGTTMVSNHYFWRASA